MRCLTAFTLTLTVALVASDGGCGKYDECTNDENLNLGMCCPGCASIGGLVIGGNSPGGVACSCPTECLTAKYTGLPGQPGGPSLAWPTAELPFAIKDPSCSEPNVNFGYCCPGCEGVGSVIIGGGDCGASICVGCNGCPSGLVERTTTAGASIITTSVAITTLPSTETVTTTTLPSTEIVTTTTVYDPANIDCVETRDVCTAACELAEDRHYTLITAAEAKGRACVGATDCVRGEGACAPVLHPMPHGMRAVPATPSVMKRRGGGAVAGVVIGLLVLVGAVVGGVMYKQQLATVDNQGPSMPTIKYQVDLPATEA